MRQEISHFRVKIYLNVYLIYFQSKVGDPPSHGTSFLCAFVFLYNGLMMNYTGGPKQLLDNTHSLTMRYVRLETSLYSQTSVHERLES